MIRLRYPSRCARCGALLAAGTEVWWDADTRSGTCSGCHGEPPGVTDGTGPLEVAAGIGSPPGPVPAPVGVAGGSARQEYQRRHDRRQERIEEKWGRLAGVAKFVSNDPQSMMAWAKGSEGERRLAAHLRGALGERAVLLHDRKVPRTRGNIDHLAIASSGVWVIDAKNYAGMVEHRDVGRWLQTDLRIYVDGRDRTKMADGMGWQLDAVRGALDGAVVPVHAAVCFIEAEWKLFARPFQHDGVWITWAKKLAEMIAEPGPLSVAQVTDVANRLAAALPPVPPKGNGRGSGRTTSSPATRAIRTTASRTRKNLIGETDIGREHRPSSPDIAHNIRRQMEPPSYSPSSLLSALPGGRQFYPACPKATERPRPDPASS